MLAAYLEQSRSALVGRAGGNLNDDQREFWTSQINSWALVKPNVVHEKAMFFAKKMRMGR